METLRENYPPFAWLLGHELPGHPRHPRILTLLGTGATARTTTRTGGPPSACPPASTPWGKPG
ncbi:MAG: hypothetical protein ACLRWQ_17330 [Flavonifractor plautii]